jgi:ketosteroid isomerase-like protein
MSKNDVEFVTQFQSVMLGPADIKPLLDDDQLWADLAETTLFDPEAEIRFLGPGESPVGGLIGPFRGVEGLRGGLREWLKPWEEYRVEADQILDAGSGRVLTLVQQHGQMKGGAEVSQSSATITQVREGTIVGMDFYLDQDQARRDAGLG